LNKKRVSFTAEAEKSFHEKEEKMNRICKTALLVTFLIIPVLTLAIAERQDSFTPYVDGEGAITLPPDFRATWVHLGTWIVTSQAATGPEQNKISHTNGIHEVFIQPESLKAYQKTGSWPDGAVLILKVRPVQWDDMPTGHVMYAGDTIEISVMVKDSTNRFKRHANWGEGWGWGLFKANDLKKNASQDHKIDCLGCHEVAKDTEWVFIQGYPTLR